MQCLRRLIWDEQGPTAVEYAVMMGMILLVVIGAVGTVGTNTNNMWVRIMNNLSSVVFGN
jgi:pilus assembly protein Flp/PilA